MDPPRERSPAGPVATRAPACSVIVPAYNAARTVGAAVRSALDQQMGDLEVVVIDDGSTDATGQVIGRLGDPRVRLVTQTNRGLSAARNAGLASARGRYVAFLDADDLWLPDYLELMVAALEDKPSAGFAYTDAYAFQSESGRVRRRTAMERMRPPIPPPPGAAGFLLELLRRNFIYVSTTVPLSVIEEVGGFDEARTSVEDYELWMRILVSGRDPVWVAGQHALYRVHRDQMSADAPRMCRNLLAVYEDLPMDGMPSDEHRRLLAEMRRRAARNVALAAGDAPLRDRMARLRHVLGRARKRAGLGDRWYDHPPAPVARAFPDLRSV